MFAMKNTKRHIAYLDDEPPDKKLISDGDLLIKELYKKQTNTETNLKEQLNKTKTFEKSTEFVPLTSYTTGSNSLQDFQTIIQQSNEIETLKAAGLTADDIKLFFDSKRGDGYLNKTHKNFEKSVLKERLEIIGTKIANYHKKRECCEEKQNLVSRHKSEFALSVKPNSTETKLLQFALDNRKLDNSSAPNPMDGIKEFEKQWFGSTEKLDLSKIRKKARNLQNKIAKIGNTVEENCPRKKSNDVSFSSNSKWDVKESVPCEQAAQKIAKQYTCKPQNLYTVKDGQIVEITSVGHVENTTKNDGSERVSLEDIKKDPKFANYETGEESKVLYLKNLHKKVTEKDVIGLLLRFTNESFDVKVLTGKMSGQCFVTFESVDTAKKLLHEITGIVLHNKPVVAMFGRRKT